MCLLNQKQIGIYNLRLGLAIVFIYFGISQLLNQSGWVYMLPDKIFGLSLSDSIKPNLIIANGIFDLMIAGSLITGVFLKVFSLLGFLHLLSIAFFTLGFGPSGMRDIGLAFAMLSNFFLANKNEKIKT